MRPWSFVCEACFYFGQTEAKTESADRDSGRYLDHVIFQVGPQAVPFMVHTGVLIERCPAFAESVMGATAIGDKVAFDGRKINLPDEEARIFWIFVVWLYTEELVPPLEDLGTDTEGIEARSHEPRLRFARKVWPGTELWDDEDLVDAYIFGRKHHMDSLSTLAVSTLAAENEKLQRTASLAAVCQAFGAGHWAKLLCDYLVDEADWRLVCDYCDRIEDASPFPPEYISRVEERELTKCNAPVSYNWWREAPCRYHIHHGLKEQERCALTWAEPGPDGRYNADVYEQLKDVGIVLVDAVAYPLVLHKGLISGQAEYFRRAFSGSFAEGKEAQIQLAEENLRIFLMMVDFVYTRIVREPTHEDRQALRALSDQRPETCHEPDSVMGETLGRTLVACSDPSPPTMAAEIRVTCARQTHQEELVELYILADRRDVRLLRDDIMNELIVQREQGWPLVTSRHPVIYAAFVSLPNSSKLCKYTVQEATWGWTEGNSQKRELIKLPPDFLGQVVGKMLKLRAEAVLRPFWRGNICLYHEHADDAEKASFRLDWKEFQATLKEKGAVLEPVET
ncbi:hypothetical protein LTR85_010328 [Meristemomyces frigidus]|nr:hypothetical protein LTR85_010328 [Meristemomyces frigidus]